MSTEAAPVASAATDDADLDWLLQGFKRRVPGVLHAIAVTADGFHLASTAGLGEAARRQLCAMTCGLSSLMGTLAAQLERGRCRQLLVETERGTLVVAAISDGSALAVLAGRRADLGHVGYEVEMLVTRVGQVLTPALRERLTHGAVR
ncbi:roadblock/LC7 domain-containing protein [Kineococcus gypseus]|uniref:roadblock/LC7 domain-containing protein n=1 Tax=Kineococcus gypseus TaxID=1637102 RepID=UPI003D7DB820